jgi:hypothetical protein
MGGARRVILFADSNGESTVVWEDVNVELLRSLYHLAIRIWAVVMALFSYVVVNYVAPAVPATWSWLDLRNHMVGLATSGVVLSIMFLVGAWLIRTRAWKWVQPGLDLDGEWLGETFYTRLEQPTTAVTSKDFHAFSREHDVHISQDCLGISIKPSKGASFTDWGSITGTLDRDCNFSFLYWVNYGDRDRFPKTAHGYERLCATKHEKALRRGRPILLTGSFYHCAGMEKPIYSGNTVFIRRGLEHLLRPEDMPAFAQNGILSAKLSGARK